MASWVLLRRRPPPPPQDPPADYIDSTARRL
jgi:hypothetical protein